MPMPGSRLFAAAAALALLTGAAPIQAAEPPSLPVEGLAELEHEGLDLLMVRPGARLADYSRVMLSPIRISVKRERSDIVLQPRDEEHATTYFREKLSDSLGGALVETAGPGVLKLDILLTEFVPNHPMVAERADRLGGPMLRSYSVGEAAFQAVLTDATTGQVVAVLADADRGVPFGSNFNLTTQYGDADTIIRRWSRRIAGLLGPAQS